jgi:hypothetical protein
MFTVTPSRLPFNICHICLNDHHHIFDDVIGALRGSLVDLGHDCSLMRNTMKRGRINIVVGSTIFIYNRGTAVEDLKKRPYILYQLEQMSAQAAHVANNPWYFEMLEAAARVWEYSPNGMAFLGRTQLKDKLSFFPPAHHRSLEHFAPAAAAEQDIDVLFYGTPSERRTAVVEQLRAAGVNAVALFGVYGEALYAQLRRAKIVLNLHAATELPVLETVRLSFLLANRCFVVSEPGEYNPYGDGVVFAPYDQIVACCLHCLSAGDEARRRVADAGYAAVRRSDLTAQLRREIETLPIARLLPEAGLG